MNENINLCEILKGHEGETFYSPIFGELILSIINFGTLEFNSIKNDIIVIESSGKFYEKADEIAVYPSKDQRDWNKWVEEQEPKVPKTWSELIKTDGIDYNLVVESGPLQYCPPSPIEKSALALLKIHQLIKVGYGGNVTNEEWDKKYVCFVIRYDTMYKRFIVGRCVSNIQHIAFRTKEQAEKFLKYPENVQLLNDYFMI